MLVTSWKYAFRLHKYIKVFANFEHEKCIVSNLNAHFQELNKKLW